MFIVRSGLTFFNELCDKIGQSVQNLFIFGFVFLFSFLAYSQQLCFLNLKSFPVHQGTLMKREKGVSYFLLGKGSFGGDVYRVFRGTSSFLEKHYMDKLNMEAELRAWKFLDFISSHGKVLSYRFIRYKETENPLVYRSDQDFKGMDLYSLLNHQDLSPAEKAVLRQEYQLFLEKFLSFFKRFQEQGEKGDYKVLGIYPGGLYGEKALQVDLLDSDNQLVKIFLHAKNLLVTSGGLVLIDPN
ncbi:MAG: hypothetical protein D6797_02355 [Bdellovibrio sp.]|nr:MAG: hypothetical protein D6797_02355 [Bdellovibrio sp.]